MQSYIKVYSIIRTFNQALLVNRWIVGIKLFQFELVHIPGCLHTGPDGLSCHAYFPNDPIDEDEDAG